MWCGASTPGGEFNTMATCMSCADGSEGGPLPGDECGVASSRSIA